MGARSNLTAYCSPNEDGDACCGSNPSAYGQKCPFIDCCNGARGKHYCSPISGNGYDTKAKTYYFDCSVCQDSHCEEYASPRSLSCHTQAEWASSADGFY